jgi:hypothetical protein
MKSEIDSFESWKFSKHSRQSDRHQSSSFLSRKSCFTKLRQSSAGPSTATSAVIEKSGNEKSKQSGKPSETSGFFCLANCSNRSKAFGANAIRKLAVVINSKDMSPARARYNP